MVIEVKLTWRALHVHVDDTLRLGRKVRSGSERRARRRRIRKRGAVRTNKLIGTGRSVTAKQTCQRRTAKTCTDRRSDCSKEPAPRQIEEVFLKCVGVRGHGAL